MLKNLCGDWLIKEKRKFFRGFLKPAKANMAKGMFLTEKNIYRLYGTAGVKNQA